MKHSANLPYAVLPISYGDAKEFVLAHHYAGGISNTTTGAYGLFDERLRIIGVCAFATPCSENVRRSVFGPEHAGRVTELHRLVILDVTPKNAESFFIARALDLLKNQKPHLWSVVSFADQTFGHVGTIYQASNARYYGQSKPEWCFRDGDGRLRHRRQSGVNISREEGIRRGWTVLPSKPKHRYCLLLPDDRRHQRQLADWLLLPARPYPKLGYTNGYTAGGACLGIKASV